VFREKLRAFVDRFNDRFVPWRSFWRSVLREMGSTPATWILPGGVILLFGLIAFYLNQRTRPRSAFVWGCFHGLVHIAGMLLFTWLLGKALVEDPNDVDKFDRTAFYLIVVIGGGFASGALVGIYLVVSERVFGWHDNEVFSCQSIEGYANFVRMHVDEKEGLTIYPIGVTRVPRKWNQRLGRRPGESKMEPVNAEDLEAHLIEGPVRIGPTGA
jgi:hypothetical protein